MNSIFSSFDVVSAEFLGQRGKSSFFSFKKVEGSHIESQQKSFLQKATDYMSKKERNSAPPAHVKQQTAPRFAPELDGLNCFETLVSF